MKFTLVICTYLRPQQLLALLRSVAKQTYYPNQILVIDGSTDASTQLIVVESTFENLQYYKVTPEVRGLTKQRNYGISKVTPGIDVVCFVDDDTILEMNYFEKLINTFESYKDITGVGGVAINENNWKLKEIRGRYNSKKYYTFEGFVYRESQRNILRNYLGLQSNLGPGKMPNYSHGRTCGFPLNDKIYHVDLLIGMSMAFRKNVVDEINFSTYFEGYGLYEDCDFSIRALSFGRNVINTSVQLSHFHSPSGRPNQYNYGKMVVRNGWYVWRVKNPKPKFIDRFKWNAITLLLILIRFLNIFTTSSSKNALTETAGRMIGWFSLFFSKPK